MTDMPQLNTDLLPAIDPAELTRPAQMTHKPRILLLYGSLRDTSYSRLMSEEAARVLTHLGAETKTYDPHGLPLVDDCETDHPKVQELRDLVMWSEGMVWCSPERHGTMTGVMKTLIDWLPLAPIGGIRPTQGKTLALMQVCGGSQSFNTVNQMRILGRWMRLLTIPNQSSVAKAWNEFEGGRMKPGPFYNRMVDVMEELVRFTYLTRDRNDLLIDRYSERVESVQELSARVNKKS